MTTRAARKVNSRGELSPGGAAPRRNAYTANTAATRLLRALSRSVRVAVEINMAKTALGMSKRTW